MNLASYGNFEKQDTVRWNLESNLNSSYMYGENLIAIFLLHYVYFYHE